MERIGIFAVASMLLVGSAVGEELERLEANRPDFTETPSTVAAGHLQLEMGATLSKDEAGGVTTRNLTYPETLLRYGVVDNLELQLGWEGRSRIDEGGTIASGNNDASLALKYRLLNTPDSPLALTLLVGSTLPVGSNGYTSDAYDPMINFVWGAELGEALSITGSFLGNWYTEVDPVTGLKQRHLQHLASVSLGLGVGDNMGAFLEWVRYDPDENGALAGQYASTGLTYYVGNDLSVDAHISKGLNDIATDRLVGVGFAKRF